MSEATTATEVGTRSMAPRPVLSALLAIVASAATLAIIHAKYPVFLVPSEYDIGMGASVEQRTALADQQSLAERKNAPLFIAVAGSLLAATVAMGTPACCPAIVRILVALVWGAIWGAGAGYVGALVYQRLIPIEVQPTVADTVKVQATFLAILGIGMGLLVGAFGRSIRTAFAGVVAGALAGGLGGMAYPILTAMLMSGKSTEGLIPESPIVRPLWLCLSFALIGFIVPAIAFPAAQSKPSPAGAGEPDKKP